MTLHRARTLLDLGRHELARAELARVLADDPQSTEAWCLFAQCEQKTGNLNGMLYASRQALASNPDSEWAFRLQSLALHKLGWHSEAVNSARESIRLAPHQWQQYVVLVTAMIPLLAVHRDEAWRAADRAVELAPLQAETHLTRGVLAGAAGNLPVAEANYREALRLEPDNAIARNNLATIELRANNVEAATAGFAAALAENPMLQVARNNIDLVCWRVMRAALLSANVVFIGSAVLALGGDGPIAFVLTLTALMLVMWLAMAWRMVSRLAPPVRTHLRGMIRDHRSYKYLVIAYLAATLATPWMPAPLLGAGLLLTVVMALRLRLRRARTP